MRAPATAIARGASWKLGSDLLGRLLQYALLWAAARSLEPADFGDFTFAISVGLMLAQVADFGLQLFVQRELSRLARPGAAARLGFVRTSTGRGKQRPYFSDEAAAGRLVGGGLAIKSVLSLAALALVTALVLLEPVGNKGALVLVGVSAILGTVLEYFSYCFRALGLLKVEALASLLGRFVNLSLGAGLLLGGAGVWGLAVAGNIAMLAAIVAIYSRLLYYIRPIWRPDLPYWKRVLGQPTAIGIGVIFSIISFRVDNLLIPPLSGREALGAYNVAYKLFEPSQILPGVLLAATFPLIVQAAKSGGPERSRKQKGSLMQLVTQNAYILLALGAAVALCVFIFAVPVLGLLYGTKYDASAPVLQILALACIPMYLNYLLTHTLIAMDKPRLFACFTLAALVVNVAANLALVPSLGIRGAAWATVLTEVALLLLCALVVSRSLRRFSAAGAAEAVPERGVESLP